MARYTFITFMLFCICVSGCKGNEGHFLSACSNGNYQGMALMLKQGINKDMQINGMTCLMAAAGGGHTNLVEKLLALNANTELSDNNGNTALDYATHYGHQQIVEMITKHQETIQQAKQHQQQEAEQLALQQQQAERFAALSEQDKQQIFLELTQIWKDGGEGKSELLTKYNISEQHLKIIQDEGLTHDWPTVDPTPTP
jgi:ankyrin repeat protein